MKQRTQTILIVKTSTAEQSESPASLDLNPLAGLVHDVGNIDIPKNQLDGMLKVIDSGLGALSPSVGTVREFGDLEREACKIGLETLKAALNGLKAFGVCHRARQ